MVDDDGGQVVEAGSGVWAAGFVQVGEQEGRHVQTMQGKLDVIVKLGPRVGAPPETLQMKAQDLRSFLGTKKMVKITKITTWNFVSVPNTAR